MAKSTEQEQRSQGGAKRGRPSSFKPEFSEQAEKLCRIGALDVDLADFFGVHVDTIYEWKKKRHAFSEAIKRGKALADREVAEKLIERAMGAQYYQDKEVKLKETGFDAKGKKWEKERVEVVRLHMTAPPDTTAGIFFLANRRPDLWRHIQTIKHANDPENPFGITTIYLPANGRDAKPVDTPAKSPQHRVKK